MLDRKYLEKQKENERWSKVKFPVEDLKTRTFSSGKQRSDL